MPAYIVGFFSSIQTLLYYIILYYIILYYIILYYILNYKVGDCLFPHYQPAFSFFPLSATRV
uniref:Uncharacterized protein n=1 Tax=Helianthus annuus TaxID=4232 RepID=A0A251RXA6_HELAN